MANEGHLRIFKQGVEVWNTWRRENVSLLPDLSGANLGEADLSGATLGNTHLEKAVLKNCRICGSSAWDVSLEAETDQHGWIITPPQAPSITVDDLEVAQAIYLVLSDPRMSHLIDAVPAKVVLILGRFSGERKAVLDAIRGELERKDCVPVLVDFDTPASKDVRGTVETLARMARFIIADLPDPSSIPYELATIVPSLRTTPVLPLRLSGSKPSSLFEDLRRAYPGGLKPYEDQDGASLIATLPAVIAPAEELAEDLRRPRP